jgi:uncharacterized phiE125 gp8 family phage protein
VSITIVKLNCGIDAADTTFDLLLDGYIRAATKFAEEWTGRSFINKPHIAYWHNSFPSVLGFRCAPELFEVINIKYLDTDGVEQTLAADQYKIYKWENIINIVPAESVVWPEVIDEPDAVKLRTLLGYGNDTADVPNDIQIGLAQIVTHMFNNRGDCSETNMYIEKILTSHFSPYKLIDLGMVYNQCQPRYFGGYYC